LNQHRKRGKLFFNFERNYFFPEQLFQEEEEKKIKEKTKLYKKKKPSRRNI
jgi:hypothetical protein